jgi:hypothetical protein
MPLINAFEPATPSPRACMVDAPVMGGTIAQMIDLANHLGVGRARRVVHSNFTRGQGIFADLVDRTDIFTAFTDPPSSSETLEIPWLSSPLGRYAYLFLTIQASGTTPAIVAELYKLDVTGAAHTLIDAGCQWNTTNNRLTPSVRRGQVVTYPIQTIGTGAQVQATGAGVSDPRPLVIPLANRGDRLMVRLSCAEVRVEAVDIFELYEESWS